MDTIPNGLDSKSAHKTKWTSSRKTQSQMVTVPNEHNPDRMDTIPIEWTPSRVDTIPNGNDLEWTPSRMDTIPNGHHPQ